MLEREERKVMGPSYFVPQKVRIFAPGAPEEKEVKGEEEDKLLFDATVFNVNPEFCRRKREGEKKEGTN